MQINDLVIIKDKPFVTYILDSFEGKSALLRHAFIEGLLLRVPLDSIMPFQIYSSRPVDRSLKFLNDNKSLLNYVDNCELEAINCVFFLKNIISTAQLQKIAQMQGKLASIHFSGDINKAIDLVNVNEKILDSFNQRWYSHYSRFFSKQQIPLMDNQRNAIFNIAGFVLSELNIALKD